MAWDNVSDVPIVSSFAQIADDHPYCVIDHRDGTALFQLDIEASWSTVLQILKTLKADENGSHKALLQ